MKKIAVFGLVALMFAGCTTIEPVDPSKQADVGDGVLISPQVAWGRVGSGNDQYWTIDGIGLNELHFYTGIASGKAIVEKGSKSTRAELGFYSDTMLPNDVMDLVARSLGKMGYTNVHAANLAPAPFGSATGFRFDLTLDNADGLDLKGEVLAAQRGGKLDMIVYLAPTEYYFAKTQPTVEKIFGSVHLAGG